MPHLPRPGRLSPTLGSPTPLSPPPAALPLRPPDDTTSVAKEKGQKVGLDTISINSYQADLDRVVACMFGGGKDADGRSSSDGVV